LEPSQSALARELLRFSNTSDRSDFRPKGGEMTRQQFGTRLRLLRERVGLTQTQLGAKVGVSQGNVATWERNAAVPQSAMVEQLAAALGVPAVELLVGRPPGPFIPVNPRKRTIRLTADNFAEHFSTEYGASLVQGFTAPEDGIDHHDRRVDELLAWVERENGHREDVRYVVSRHVAAVLLERLAGPGG
jgi:transcriptional regulator with XRE-family HTH domain